MARYPKAIWRPIDRYQPGGSSCVRMSEPRRFNLHTAVSNSESLYGLMSQPGRATSHFYVRKDGKVEQYVDTAYRSSACLEGNPDSITVETWDGYPHGWSNGSDVPNWTPEQVATLADMAAWAHKTHGIPLELVPNSKPGTHGVSYHRQGIDDWRVNGGEYWSKSRGKVCPGDRRVAQIDEIIAKAKAGGEDEDEVKEEDIEAIAARVNGVLGDYNAKGKPRNPDDKENAENGDVRLRQLENTVRRIEDKVEKLLKQ